MTRPKPSEPDDALLRYVDHEDIQFYEAEGWVIASTMEGTYAGEFAVLMQFQSSD